MNSISKLPGCAAMTLLLAAVVPANAADLAVKAMPVPVATVYNWTGMYVGVNGGYGWGNQATKILST